MTSRLDLYFLQRDSAPSYSTKDTYVARSRGRPALDAIQTNNHRATLSQDPPPHKDLPSLMSNASFMSLPDERRFALVLSRMWPLTPTPAWPQLQP